MIDTIIIIFIHSCLVSIVTEFIERYTLHYMVAMDFFAASRFYNFFNKYCSNLLKNPTVRGLIIIILL